jgi:hypothetical protein
MATNTELFDLINGTIDNKRLFDKIAVAITLQAIAVRSEVDTTPNHNNRIVWAKQAIQNPVAMCDEMKWDIIGQYAAQTTNAIVNATDAAILTAVASAVNLQAQG